MNARMLSSRTGVVLPSRAASGRVSRCRPVRAVTSMKTGIEFIRGIEEQCVPDVRLTRSKDGSSGTAFFTFQNPTVFEASSELGDITGLYMVDDEGFITTVDVSAKFVNGKPDKIEAKHVMKSAADWDRFMRFMERYAEEHGLGFQKSGK